MEKRFARIKAAEKGARISILAYIILAISKVSVGLTLNSSSLLADGLNNLTDVLSSITVLFGLRQARKPADDDHPYGHWKAEPIASLITSFIMLFVGFQVFYTTAQRMIAGELVPPNYTAGIVALLSMFLIFFVYRYNLKLAKEVKSNGLKAVAKDNLADGLTSLATAVAIFAASFGWIWLDGIMALIVSIIILKTGIEVFRESTFSLSDGFHEEELAEYEESLENVHQIKNIESIKARMYGTNIYVDITILVDANMTVQDGHDVTEEIERILFEEFDVMHTDVHVEPYHEKKKPSDNKEKF